MIPGQLRELRNPLHHPILKHPNAHYSLRDPLDLSPINPQEFDGKDTVAERGEQHRRQD